MVISPGWLASFGAVSIPRLVGLDPRIEFFNLSSNLEAGAREGVGGYENFIHPSRGFCGKRRLKPR